MGIVIYLSTPYTHQSKSREIGLSKPDSSEKSKEIEEQRYQIVTEVAAKLSQIGFTPISPITQSHPMARDHGLSKDFNFWAEHDFTLISRSDIVMVLMQKGWQQSDGISQEVDFAKQHKIPVLYISYQNSQIILGE